MRFRRPRGITNGQIVLVSILGVFSGVYIWKPLFEQYFPRKKAIETPAQDEITPVSH